MKIRYVKGDLFEGPEKVLFHGCNAHGVMGAGVAAVVRDQYPPAYMVYKQQHRLDGLRLGTVTVYEGPDKTIVNGITQDSYGINGRFVDYDAVRSCIQILNREYSNQDVSMPMIGAGLGGGDWDIIAEIIEDESTQFQPVVYQL